MVRHEYKHLKLESLGVMLITAFRHTCTRTHSSAYWKVQWKTTLVRLVWLGPASVVLRKWPRQVPFISPNNKKKTFTFEGLRWLLTYSRNNQLTSWIGQLKSSVWMVNLPTVVRAGTLIQWERSKTPQSMFPEEGRGTRKAQQ